MTSKKNRLGNGFSSLLEANSVPLTLQKIVGDSQKSTTVRNLFTLSPTASLDTLAEDLGALPLDNSMDLFIEQYGAPLYDSLDALLEASISNTSLTQSFTTQYTEKKNLFEGLEDLLGG